jgi:hypothetical protein
MNQIDTRARCGPRKQKRRLAIPREVVIVAAAVAFAVVWLAPRQRCNQTQRSTAAE